MLNLRLQGKTLSFEVPVVMGVLNVTPDSFSDGGRFREVGRAVEHGLELAAQGASIIDVGGESTRPGAAAVPVGEELGRVIPVVERLAANGLVVSIDTRHAVVAEAALAHGAVMVNDVSGLRDPAMRVVAARYGAPVVIMHMPRGGPGTMQNHARYVDVVGEVIHFLARQVVVARESGVEQVIVDPGIGFGKTTAHNVELIRRLEEIVSLGHPVLVGASRKRFIGDITGVDQPGDRLAGTLAAHLAALDRGAVIVRVHDVAEHVQAVRMWCSLNGRLP
ncbi:MAG: dihydropteroate synthase [Actinomycetota bacterium]|nr:dihydropteroate synthase [Actinomycetota bacterium]